MTDGGLDCMKPAPRRKYTKAPNAVRAQQLRTVPDGLLPVSCWCEEHEVFVAKELVGVTTESCGLPGCVPSDQVRSCSTNEVAPGATNTEGLAATLLRRELA